MSQEDYELKSAAGVKVSSIIKLNTISPRHSKFKTIGMTFNRKKAMELARNLLILAQDPLTTGDIILTAHRRTMSLSATSYRHFCKQ